MTKRKMLFWTAVISLLLAACSLEGAKDVPTTEPTVTETEPTFLETEPIETEPLEILIAGGTCGKKMTWKLNDQGTLTISGSGKIGDYVQGSGNQPWKEYLTYITEVVIEEGITRIGDRAFQNCFDLKRAVIGKDVVQIGKRAFQDCYGLTSVEMPSDVRIESWAFYSTPVEWEINAAGPTTYKDSIYDYALSKVAWTGDYREDIITVACSQLGYHEGDSAEDYAGDNQKGTKNYTEYGRRFDSAGTAWCSEFVSWCLRTAGVPTDIVATSRSANAAQFTKNSSAKCYTWADTVYGGGSYRPRKGDILLWAWDDNIHVWEDNLSHTALLWEIEEKKNTMVLRTVDGNRDERVKVCEYKVNTRDGKLVGKTGRLYYIIAPDYEGNGG